MAEELSRIADALDRMSPAPLSAPDFESADAFLWNVSPDRLTPVTSISRVKLDLLIGINRSRDTLLQNTFQFAQGFGANNALLWGARGMGKSSLIKAVQGKLGALRGRRLGRGGAGGSPREWWVGSKRKHRSAACKDTAQRTALRQMWTTNPDSTRVKSLD